MRCKAMTRPVALGLFVSTLLSLAVPPAHHGTWWDVLDWAGNAVFMMSVVTGIVWAAWNLVHPDHSLREELEAHRAEYRAELRERAERQAEGVPAGIGQDGSALYWRAPPGPWQARWEQALAAGTVSVNGVRVPRRGKTLVVRYPGPPPVYTPPHGMDTVIHDGRLSPDYGRSCEECGEPVTEGRRFCQPCLTHGMPRYNAEIRPWL